MLTLFPSSCCHFSTPPTFLFEELFCLTKIRFVPASKIPFSSLNRRLSIFCWPRRSFPYVFESWNLAQSWAKLLLLSFYRRYFWMKLVSSTSARHMTGNMSNNIPVDQFQFQWFKNIFWAFGNVPKYFNFQY